MKNFFELSKKNLSKSFKKIFETEFFENPKNKPKLLIFSGNPTQYHAPLFRKINEVLNGQMFVMFGGSHGIRPFYSSENKSIIKWDVPTVGGYPYKVYKSFAKDSWRNFFRWNNPGMIFTVFFSPASYVLIHGYDTVSSIYVYFAALFSGKKIIFRGETVAKKGRKKTFISLLKKIILPFYFLGIHRVLWSCKDNYDSLKQYLGESKYKLISFPCAVDNDFFRSRRLNLNEQKLVRRDFKIGDDQMVIVTCSRLTKRKRTYLLLDAVKKVGSEKITILIIGDGPERSFLEAQAKKLKIDVRTFGFVGQKKVAELLAISDVFALLSSYDASPKALNEAMNFPLTIIASDGIGTARDLVLDGKNGYIYKDKDTTLLAKKIDFLLNNPQSRKDMGLINDQIISEYSLEKDVNNLREIMND